MSFSFSFFGYFMSYGRRKIISAFILIPTPYSLWSILYKNKLICGSEIAANKIKNDSDIRKIVGDIS